MDQKHLQKKKKNDILGEQQLHKLFKLISKRRKQEEPKKKLETIDKKSIIKIVTSKQKAYESFNVDIINNKDPQVQLHQ